MSPIVLLPADDTTTSWNRWVGVTRPDGTIAVWWSTNDDADLGRPSTYAERSFQVATTRDFLDACCGGSGWGLHSYRHVELDGVTITR